MTDSTQEPALRFRDLSVRFGGVHALEDVSFDVLPGTIHAVIGPNGAGKTTFFNAISGLVRPSSGSVHLHGNRIDGQSAARIATAGMARTFQNLAVFGELTVKQNLLLGRHLHGRAGWLSSGFMMPWAIRESRAQEEHVHAVAERIGVMHLMDRSASTISYGDRKRVEVGRALCMEPSVLLLDEPVAGMNHTETGRMAELIRSISRDLSITVLLVEHDMGMVMKLADTVTALNFGQLIASGAPRDIQEDPRVIEAYLGSRGGRTLSGQPSFKGAAG